MSQLSSLTLVGIVLLFKFSKSRRSQQWSQGEADRNVKMFGAGAPSYKIQYQTQTGKIEGMEKRKFGIFYPTAQQNIPKIGINPSIGNTARRGLRRLPSTTFSVRFVDESRLHYVDYPCFGRVVSQRRCHVISSAARRT